MVSEVEPSAPHGGAGPSPKQPVAEGLLMALKPILSEALVSQVGACYQFNVILPSGPQSIYFLDLTAGAAALSALSFPAGAARSPTTCGPFQTRPCSCQQFRQTHSCQELRCHLQAVMPRPWAPCPIPMSRTAQLAQLPGLRALHALQACSCQALSECILRIMSPTSHHKPVT